MKKLSTLIILSLIFSINGISQERVDSVNIKINIDTIINIDTTIAEDADKGWKISLGKNIVIMSNGDDEAIIKSADSIKFKKRKQRSNHYAGIDLGINGLVGSNKSLNLQEDAEYLDLSYGKSISLGINIYEQYFPIFHEKFGISTGLGFEFNKYSLKRDIVIYTDRDSTYGFEDSTRFIHKNLLKTEMLNLPIMLETNLGKDADHSFHLAAGAMFTYRLGSKTKQLFNQNGKEYKVKNRADYNMNPFRVNLVARIGYGKFTMYASYSLTEMFEDNKGAEVYPFTVGISLISF